MLQCNACGGTYHPILADGSAYYHACPPRSRVELAALIASGALPYPPGTTAASCHAVAIDAADPAVTPHLLAADAWLALGPIARATARDENLVVDPATGKATMKAAGAGVTVLPDPAPTLTVV